VDDAQYQSLVATLSEWAEAHGLHYGCSTTMALDDNGFLWRGPGLPFVTEVRVYFERELGGWKTLVGKVTADG
jgi:hypothetical protein